MSKIPKHAKKVFHGTVFHVYQWEQEMFDSQVKIFEQAKAEDGVSVIAVTGNKIIVLQQKQPGTKWYISLPGGGLDHPGESPKAGAARELLEETGYKAKSLNLLAKIPRGGRVTSQHYIFIAKDCKKIAEQTLDGGEIINVKLLNFEDFLKLSDNKDFRNRDVTIELLRARLTRKSKNAFKNLLFD